MGFFRASLRGLHIPLSPTPRISPHTTLHPLHDARAVALVVSRTYSTEPSSSKLALRYGDVSFGLERPYFSEIADWHGYFDKTSHIPLIQNGPSRQLFCRPNQFGKSVTITMLEQFHAVQHLRNYDRLFKVRGYDVLFRRHLCVHITYAKIRVSPWTDLLKMGTLDLGNILF